MPHEFGGTYILNRVDKIKREFIMNLIESCFLLPAKHDNGKDWGIGHGRYHYTRFYYLFFLRFGRLRDYGYIAPAEWREDSGLGVVMLLSGM